MDIVAEVTQQQISPQAVAAAASDQRTDRQLCITVRVQAAVVSVSHWRYGR